MIVFKAITEDAKTLHYVIKTGAGRNPVFVKHPKTKKRAAARYATNQESIFVSEQVGDLITPAVIMSEGFLKVSENDELLLQFLRLSPQYNVNFVEVDPEKEAADKLERKELVLDIHSEIRAMTKKGAPGFAKLASLLLIKSRNADVKLELTPQQVDEMGPSQISESLYNMAENKPEDFVDAKGKVNCFDNNNFVRQDIVIRGLKNGIIRVSPTGREVFWDNGELLLDIPLGQRYREYLADFFLSDEGEKVMQDIAKAL